MFTASTTLPDDTYVSSTLLTIIAGDTWAGEILGGLLEAALNASSWSLAGISMDGYPGILVTFQDTYHQSYGLQTVTLVNGPFQPPTSKFVTLALADVPTYLQDTQTPTQSPIRLGASRIVVPPGTKYVTVAQTSRTRAGPYTYLVQKPVTPPLEHYHHDGNLGEIVPNVTTYIYEGDAQIQVPCYTVLTVH